MISQPRSSTIIEATRALFTAFVQVMRNRRELRELDAAQLADAGITSEALHDATNWRFWRQVGLVDVSGRPAIPVVALPAQRVHGVPAASAACLSQRSAPGRVRAICEGQTRSASAGAPALTGWRSATQH